MSNQDRLFQMPFSKLYPLYVAKAEKKGRTKAEVNQIITWLMGYDEAQLEAIEQSNVEVKAFFDQAPKFNDNAKMITGVVCGVRIEEIEDQTMKRIRYLDKLIDELARGKKMEKILRQ